MLKLIMVYSTFNSSTELAADHKERNFASYKGNKLHMADAPGALRSLFPQAPCCGRRMFLVREPCVSCIDVKNQVKIWRKFRLLGLRCEGRKKKELTAIKSDRRSPGGE